MNAISENLTQFIEARKGEFELISDSRKNQLDQFAAYISEKRKTGEVQLIFICTHNSRRSHLSHIWCQIAAEYHGIEEVKAFSGGTEATSMFPQLVNTFEKQGLTVVKNTEGQNPEYQISFASDRPPIIAFSKIYDDPFNPQENFGAVMVCSNADENCPFIPTCDRRISLPYEDPKEFDGSAQMEEGYLNRSTEIAREFFYLFSKVN
ncbi:protein-tyrosine-phosphatase [Paracrocinitomix mangrovi]|uniref:protein-tyrosine-phosphatase n=1 Tax=Paracrocinitomix mangrovi TaxID=2862509 RepID=UPI001C8D9F03|nr:protein-tyrosine-phosphatase [Paracrocinitomix mangrovi]UKN02557.1 protein-tyrosine-phosphatase [Paracrocinitomix mangrovi]